MDVVVGEVGGPQPGAAERGPQPGHSKRALARPAEVDRQQARAIVRTVRSPIRSCSGVVWSTTITSQPAGPAPPGNAGRSSSRSQAATGRPAYDVAEGADAARAPGSAARAAAISGSPKRWRVVLQLAHLAEVVRPSPQLGPPSTAPGAQVREVGEHLPQRSFDRSLRIEAGARGEGQRAGPAVAADGEAGDDRHRQVDPVVEGVNVVSVQSRPVDQRPRIVLVHDARSISVSRAPPYQPSRNASRSISSSRPKRIASSRQLPIAQPLEHSKTKLSVPLRCRSDQPGRHQDRAVVAQRVAPHPRDPAAG